ncbi:Protein of unknown function DUF617 [Macleaya cordata]|uniref:Protein MIZU-KUSSEI 1 n=1 Tax=Macleaya cordata TaxID=56857 RepID=A0A200QYL5_MACCD|nr:Protein of unknown function DUF617 [Macleaya cordata]
MDEKVVPEYYPSYNDNNNNKDSNPNKYSLQPPRQLPPPPPAPPVVPLKSVVTGTFYGHRKGHICFCIQKDRLNYAKPPLLLELSIPTDDLVKEMQRELVRIVLECDSSSNKSSCRLLSIPIWTMYVNGRKVGFAARRRPTDKDRLILKTMQSTTVGAGVIPKELATMESSHYPHHQGGGGADDGGGSGAGDGDELIFMRANYKRVVGSFDTESFHLTNPDGCLSSQELSVFLMRSR